jgi:hypothetical protein
LDAIILDSMAGGENRRKMPRFPEARLKKSEHFRKFPLWDARALGDFDLLKLAPGFPELLEFPEMAARIAVTKGNRYFDGNLAGAGLMGGLAAHVK